MNEDLPYVQESRHPSEPQNRKAEYRRANRVSRRQHQRPLAQSVELCYARHMNDPTCKACSGARPRPDHFIADLGLTRVYLHDDQFFPGWTVLVLGRHATELFHLAPAERVQLIEEMNLVAKALHQVYEPRKINYELLGNQMPHIHWHLIPRLVNDPAPLEPVWRVPHEPVLLSDADLHGTIQRLHQAIQNAR